MNPMTTGGVALSATMIGSVIIWLCGVARITAPPADVAGALAALAMAGAHSLGVYLNSRKPVAPPR